jgi:glycosyltransferase involved in cell wall biosynthesis
MISCIIPVHNGARFIREAIVSVLEQDYRPIEVIVVDDGSTDDTAAVVQQFADVRYVHQVNAGPGAARNAGLAMTDGEFVAFLDSDDSWAPHKLSRQLEFLNQHPDVACCLCRVRHFWEDEVRAEEAHYERTAKVEVGGFASSTMLARRSLFDAIGSFDEQLRHVTTIEWFKRARASGAITHELDEVLVHRRMHSANLGRQEAATREEFLQMAKRAINEARAAKHAASPKLA